MWVRRRRPNGRTHNTPSQEALQLKQHREVPPSPASACGKMGSLATLDLIVEGCCAYIEGDDRGPKLWDRVSTVLASVRARTTVVLASGHVESGEGSNGALHSACWRVLNSQFDPRQHMESQEEQTEWEGEAHTGPHNWARVRRSRARECQVKGCEKAETWTNQTRYRDLRSHLLTVVRRYKLAVSRSQDGTTH